MNYCSLPILFPALLSMAAETLIVDSECAVQVNGQYKCKSAREGASIMHVLETLM